MPPMNYREAQRDARKGAKLLDAYFGKRSWRQVINPSTLDIELWNKCILGQIFGSYSLGLATLGLWNPEAMELGFSAPSATAVRHHADCNRLTRAWIELLDKEPVACSF